MIKLTKHVAVLKCQRNRPALCHLVSSPFQNLSSSVAPPPPAPGPPFALINEDCYCDFPSDCSSGPSGHQPWTPVDTTGSVDKKDEPATKGEMCKSPNKWVKVEKSDFKYFDEMMGGHGKRPGKERTTQTHKTMKI